MLAAFSQEIGHLVTSFIRLVYPAFCIFCSKSLQITENYSCEECLSHLPALREPLCKKCSMELAPYSESKRCPSCSGFKTYYDSGKACFRYDEQMKSFFQNVKFSKKPWYLNIFKGFSLAARLPSPIYEYDMIVPVPLDKKRMHEREFNQSELIAKLLSRTIGAPHVCRALKKIKHTESQSSLDRRKRLDNLKDTFHVRKNVNVEGKKILIVDDIVTTSATVNECARSLKQSGAKEVDFFSLARTIQWLN